MDIDGSFDNANWVRLMAQGEGTNKSFRTYMSKSKSKTVKEPGKHGSTNWYVDDNGIIRYGKKPNPEASKRQAVEGLRRTVSSILMSDDHKWAFVTAFHKSRTYQQNLNLNGQLFKDLHRRGGHVLSCKGYYTYRDDVGEQHTTEEPAFLAIGLGAKDAILLGHKYSQESILSNRGFYDCNKPERTKVTSKKVIDGDIAKNQDQSVIFLPGRNLTFLVDGDWANPEQVSSLSGLYGHLKAAKSFGGGQSGGYAPPTPPTNNMVLIAAEVDLESHLR